MNQLFPHRKQQAVQDREKKKKKEREGSQGKPKNLRVEKTEIKVLEVLEFSKQCPGEEEAIHKKKSKQTNKQKSSQRRL